MISKINQILYYLFDIILSPVSQCSQEIQICYISFLSGIIFLLIYGKVSNQKGLKATKRKVMAYVLEVALYRHSIKVCLKAQLNMLKQGFRYLSFALIPLLILMVPCILIMAELNSHFGYQGLKKGEEAIIEVDLGENQDAMVYSLKQDIGDLSDALRVEDEGKIFWKIKNNVADENQKEAMLTLTEDDKTLNFPVSFNANETPKVLMYSSDVITSLLFPSKNNIKNNDLNIKNIKITYPENIQSYAGYEMHWLWVFLIVSILSGLVTSKVFKIEI